MEGKKKSRGLLNRIINIILILIIIISGIKLAPQLWEIYQDWKLKGQFNNLVLKDSGDGEVIISPDWKALQEQNKDIIGWIAIPNTPISYPIVKGSDNDYYLTHSVEHQQSRFGSIFMDANSKTLFKDFNTIIYGHNVAGHATMFSKITDFLKPEFFEKTKDFYILTPEQNYKVEILSVNKVIDATDPYRINFDNSQQVVNMVNQTRNTAQMKNDIDFKAGDKVITLSTCDLNFGLNSPNRVILTGKLVPYKGEVKIKLT